MPVGWNTLHRDPQRLIPQRVISVQLAVQSDIPSPPAHLPCSLNYHLVNHAQLLLLAMPLRAARWRFVELQGVAASFKLERERFLLALARAES